MYSDEQLQELRQYESEIRHAEIKLLCNGASVTKMRAIIRNLLDHILIDQTVAQDKINGDDIKLMTPEEFLGLDNQETE